MFTGIVEEAGEVVDVLSGKKSTELTIRAKKVVATLRVGSSVAVNGACLTVVSKHKNQLQFDVLNETLARTNFGTLGPGSRVNLERPMRADGRLDGHFVQGHVDGTGLVKRFEAVGKDYVLEVRAPKDLMKYIVEKGSLAVDGISLTVAGVGRDWFRIWIIPHTRAITNLKDRCPGEPVNLEVDILAKYVERVISGRRR
jgi:riboflavin synthase